MLSLRHLPNLLTLLRIVAVVPLIVLLLAEHYDGALVLFGLAGLSDGLDGYLAKRYGWTSRLGSILDPLADKLLLTVTFLLLGALDHLPWWLVAAVVARDLIIISGALTYHVLIGAYEMHPSVLSKLNTLVQILLLFAVLIHLSSLALVPESAVRGLVHLTLLTTLASGAHYVWTWGRRALRAGRG